MPNRSVAFRVDVVVAVRDEESTIPSFIATLDGLPLPTGCDLGVIFVEDSSRDGTRDILASLSASRPEIGYFALARGFGQGPAIIFGTNESSADAVIMMDVDGGHSPDAIPAMIRAWREGAQVVQCVRRTLEGRTALRRVGTAGFRFVLRILTGDDFRLHSIYYRLVSREVIDTWLTTPRYWRFLRFPLLSKRDALRTIEVDAAERSAGESKYGLGRLIGLGLNGIISLLTPRRVALWSGLAVLSAMWLGFLQFWPASLLLFAGGAALVRRSYQLDHDPLLSHVQVEASTPRQWRTQQ